MTSYLVLARKYRPERFSEVVGQDVVTSVLAGALREGRIGHAYLFAGPRGTGKTTLARIFARCLNCERGPAPEPCGECERCLAVDEGNEMDLIEIDAASYTGVNTIRELRDEATYAPMRARYKVYIVDEVHMLSKPAFNALLKTLEEPPPHVVFLFATTEPHKVLDTILSRCQILRLASIPEEVIGKRLAEVFERESVRPGPGVVEALARSARGGMRDALSAADRLLALAGDEPALEDLERLGEGGYREIDAVLDRVEEGDRKGVLEAVAAFGGSAHDLVERCLSRIRTGLLLSLCGGDTPLVEGGEEERKVASERIDRVGLERARIWMEELVRTRERIRLAPGGEQVLVETVLLGLCAPESAMTLEEILTRLDELERRLGAGAAAAPGPTAAPGARRDLVPRPGKPPGSTEPSGPASPVDPAKPESERPILEAFLEELAQSHASLADLYRRSARLELAGEKARLLLPGLAGEERRLVEDARNRSASELALRRAAGREVRLSVEVESKEVESGEQEGGAQARARPQAQPAKKDEFTTKVADLFDGVIEDPA